MKIALAQIQPQKGAIQQNINKHLHFMQEALAKGAQAIFFPELSLTGYEPALAQQLAMMPQAPKLAKFQQLSDAHNIVIGMGMPTPTNGRPKISLVLFRAWQLPLCYSKQHLHEDELPYFSAGDRGQLVELGGQKMALAICYESLLEEHALQAHQSGANLYLAAVAKPQRGITKASTHYPTIARQYQMPVLMVNSVGYCDNFISAGKSAVWDNQGNLLAQAPQEQEALLIFEWSNNKTEIISY